MPVDFYFPTQLIFGCGTLARIGRLAASFGKHVLLVTSKGAWKRNPVLSQVQAWLQDAGLSITVCANVTGEADLAMVAEGLAILKAQTIELVIGLGGGSAIDTAKAIAGLAMCSGSIYEYHAGRAPEQPALPIIAIPTTAGSGAEATRNAVLINPQSGFKQSIRGDTWFPRIALVDPELTFSMGPELTAHTGSDALCQAIEAYTSIAASAVTDGIAEQAIQLLSGNLLTAVSSGADLQAREAMSMGSFLAGMAMSNARLGGVHGMAHPLGSHFHIPHGLVCGLLLPYTMRYNLDYAVVKYARIAELLGVELPRAGEREKALRAVELIQELLLRIHIPQHLREFGVQDKDFDLVIRETMPSGSTKHNIRPLQEADIRSILESAL